MRSINCNQSEPANCETKRTERKMMMMNEPSKQKRTISCSVFFLLSFFLFIAMRTEIYEQHKRFSVSFDRSLLSPHEPCEHSYEYILQFILSFSMRENGKEKKNCRTITTIVYTIHSHSQCESSEFDNNTKVSEFPWAIAISVTPRPITLNTPHAKGNEEPKFAERADSNSIFLDEASRTYRQPPQLNSPDSVSSNSIHHRMLSGWFDKIEISLSPKNMVFYSINGRIPQLLRLLLLFDVSR